MIIRGVSWAPDLHIQITEGLCDTENWSNANFAIYLIILLLLLYFWSNKYLGEHKHIFFKQAKC